MKRRDFLKWIFRGTLSAWVLGAIGAIFSFIRIPRVERREFEKEIEVGEYEDLKIGEGKFIPHLKEPLWVIRTEGGYIALSAVCTHMKCILEYKPDEKVIKCPCHAAIFDLSGNVVQGPPPNPLERYRIEIRGERVYVIL